VPGVADRVDDENGEQMSNLHTGQWDQIHLGIRARGGGWLGDGEHGEEGMRQNRPAPPRFPATDQMLVQAAQVHQTRWARPRLLLEGCEYGPQGAGTVL